MHTMGIDPESLCLTARIFPTVPIVAYRCFSTFTILFIAIQIEHCLTCLTVTFTLNLT